MFNEQINAVALLKGYQSNSIISGGGTVLVLGLGSESMKYSIKQLQKDFPNDEVCLDYIFHERFGLEGYYRIKKRKSYVNAEGHQIHPLGGTIFEKSRTPLTLWFYALFLFSVSKNGVSARELQRSLGVTYKCAWRMAYQIRSLMSQDTDKLKGIVEVDETYYGKRGTKHSGLKGKSTLLGMVERRGRVHVKVVKHRGTEVLIPAINKRISKKADIMTDDHAPYRQLPLHGYFSQSVNHSKGEFVRGFVHTNTIEGFWGQLKRSIYGTYHYVSPQHLQRYLDEFAFRYNRRHASVPVFLSLVLRACV